MPLSTDQLGSVNAPNVIHFGAFTTPPDHLSSPPSRNSVLRSALSLSHTHSTRKKVRKKSDHAEKPPYSEKTRQKWDQFQKQRKREKRILI